MILSPPSKIESVLLFLTGVFTLLANIFIYGNNYSLYISMILLALLVYLFIISYNVMFFKSDVADLFHLVVGGIGIIGLFLIFGSGSMIFNDVISVSVTGISFSSTLINLIGNGMIVLFIGLYSFLDGSRE